MRGLMGGLYRITEWIMRLSVINVLWMICSIPFFGVGLLLLSPEVKPEMITQIIFMMAVTAPFTLVPATAAMFTVARKWTTGEEDVPLFKTFFRGYKENYRQSMVGGIIFVLIAVVFIVNYRFYGSRGGTLNLLSIVFIALFVLLAAAFFNFMSMMVHFHMKFFPMLKNSMLITIGNPVNSILLLAANGIILYMSVRITFLIPFFMGSLMATVSFWFFYRSYTKIQERYEKMEQDRLEKEEAALAEGAATGETPEKD